MVCMTATRSQHLIELDKMEQGMIGYTAHQREAKMRVAIEEVLGSSLDSNLKRFPAFEYNFLRV